MKIANILLNYQKYISKIDLSDVVVSSKLNNKFIVKLIAIIEDNINDTRKSYLIKYKLEHIIVLAFLAILCGGCDDFVEIEAFCKTKYPFLNKLLSLTNGVPSHDTFRRVFMIIDCDAFNKITLIFLNKLLKRLRKVLKVDNNIKHIAVDGKVLRGSSRLNNTSKEIKHTQNLNVYDASEGIVLSTTPIDKKTNEIPVAKQVLSTLSLKNTVVSADALHTQKATVAIITSKGGDYVLGVKTNQSNFHTAIIDSFTQNKSKLKTKITDGTAHNNLEKRTFYIMNKKLVNDSQTKKWNNLKNIIIYEKECINKVTSLKTIEARYYISSLKDLDLIAEVIRAHWEIENNMIRFLDILFKEDSISIVNSKSITNFSILNKMCLTLLKYAKPLVHNNKYSLKTLRKSFTWGMEEELINILSYIDDYKLINLIKEEIEKEKRK
ncbi:MAG: ISAs1 family transposase [Acholeplasmatales bacterium]|jgi:predicted transposase YbfD/YdcC|nr:ISAs1 family transposase [Acholeplasmatales bacterium]